MKPLASVKFSHFVEQERLRQKMTRQQLADKAIVSIGCVSGLETMRNSPSLDNTFRIVGALGFDLAVQKRGEQ